MRRESRDREQCVESHEIENNASKIENNASRVTVSRQCHRQEQRVTASRQCRRQPPVSLVNGIDVNAIDRQSPSVSRQYN